MKLIDYLIVKTLPLVPKAVVARLSRPYIAGDNLDAAIACVKDLNQCGYRATLDILGEFVTGMDQAKESLQGYKDAVGAIHENNLDANVSVKPTSFGLLVDGERCREFFGELMGKVVAIDNFMRLDMEDSACTAKTIQLYDHFRADHGYKVGVVLQAYLRRTLQDIAEITARGRAHFRLCKGIYVEPPSLAFQGYDEIRRNFIAALEAMFDAGAYVGIATHDDFLLEHAERIIRERGLGPDCYEFQMLLGVRERVRDQIRDAGHPLRVYVPFGRDWYGYSVRRLKENPSLAGTMFKAILLKQ